MAQSKIDILQSYFDEVINKKRLDLLPKYLSDKAVMYGSPYVGLGIMPDASDGRNIIVRQVFPGSPAENKLMVNDMIIKAADNDHTWSSYDELRDGGLWGQGVIGTPLTVWVRRGNEEKEIHIMRGMVAAAKFSREFADSGMREFFNDWPDVKAKVMDAIESGDQVAWRVQYQGKNIRYNRSAVWTEYGFACFESDKIVDWYNSEENVSTLKQLGYYIRAPQMVKV